MFHNVLSFAIQAEIAHDMCASGIIIGTLGVYVHPVKYGSIMIMCASLLHILKVVHVIFIIINIIGTLGVHVWPMPIF